MPTPTVFPKIILIAEKVPSLFAETSYDRVGVLGRELSNAPDETSVELEAELPTP